MRGMSGLVVILVVIGVFCFTSVGSKMWDSVKGLEGSCYSMIDKAGIPSMGAPICTSVGHGIAVMDGFFSDMGAKITLWKEQTFGATSSGT